MTSTNKPSSRWLMSGLLFVLALTVIGIFFTIASYRNTRNQALTLGKSQLTKINDYAVKVMTLEIRNYSSYLEDYASDSITDPQQLQLTKKEQLQQFFADKSSIIEGLYLLDAAGTLVEGYQLRGDQLLPVSGQTLFFEKDKFFQQALTGSVPQNGAEYFVDNTTFLNLYRPIRDSSGTIKGLLVLPVNFENLYLTEIRPQDDDEFNGYTMVKNEVMQVIAHPAVEQIGLTIVDDRREQFPELDFSDLERLEKEQLTNEQGALSYYSYWWTEENPQKVLKLSAYQWVEIGEARWVVASIYDFNERNGELLQGIFINIGLLAILLAILVLIMLNLRTYNRQNQIYLENIRLREVHQADLAKHTLEKSLLQESKLETVGLLTTSIVHDMNNFLTPLLGNVELLMEEYQTDQELAAELGEIHEAAQKGQRLASNVLRFSKVNEGEKELLPIAKVVAEAVKTMQLLVPKSVVLQLESSMAGRAYFEKDDLQVLLYNLLTNAYQAVEKNAKITVSVQYPDEELQEKFRRHSFVYSKKWFAVIQVKDNGPGIPKAIEDKIFTPFFTTKTADGGTGLGLFIVVSIVKKNDWILDLESSEAGTIFTIGIPLQDTNS